MKKERRTKSKFSNLGFAALLTVSGACGIPCSRKYSRGNIFADSVKTDFHGVRFSRVSR